MTAVLFSTWYFLWYPVVLTIYCPPPPPNVETTNTDENGNAHGILPGLCKYRKKKVSVPMPRPTFVERASSVVTQLLDRELYVAKIQQGDFGECIFISVQVSIYPACGASDVHATSPG